MLTIRRAALHDLPGTYRVCLQTGNAGSDATTLYRNPDLLGHVFVGPYVVGQASLARVVADAEGVAGYLLGAEDSVAFAAWAEAQWWPTLRGQYPRTDGSSADDAIIRLIHTPPRAPAGIIAAFPSHLHIDLLPRAQGQGLGRALIEGLVETLRMTGSGGVHLEVGADNQNAIEFYRHLGFGELHRDGESVFMGMQLG